LFRTGDSFLCAASSLFVQNRLKKLGSADIGGAAGML
jgi:hypothetical protein